MCRPQYNVFYVILIITKDKSQDKQNFGLLVVLSTTPEKSTTAMMCVLKVMLLSLILHLAWGAKILGVFPIASISHQVVFQPIWKELSLRGHKVVVITPNPLRDPTLTNLTEIDVSVAYENFGEVVRSFKTSQTHWDFQRMLPMLSVKTAENIFTHPRVSSLLDGTNSTFDLVLAEFLSPTVTAFAYRYKCPLIGIASLSVFTHTHEAIGNPAHPILHPDLISTFGEEMSFMEKIEAVMYAFYARVKYYYYDLPILDSVVRKYFGNDMPYLGDLQRNVSLLFLNTNPVIHGARAYTTAVIELSGRMHVRPKKPLPQELKVFLDDASEGVIYFSLGSNIQSKHISETNRKYIVDTFAELPYKILWKFEDEEFPDKPSNVKISKWLPQQDILGHSNVKLFITQGGLQSLEEAITNEIPLLAIPFMTDQFANAKRITKLGIGLNLNFETLTKKDFKRSVLEVIRNTVYKQKIREIKDLLVDQPMTGLDKAIWWTEYVLRHRGAPYFRNRVVDMPWYEYFLLDVIGFVVITVGFALLVMYKMGKFFIAKTSNGLSAAKQKVT